ncbi:hypothetical protein [Vibrio cholerae]|uniref:hypothetical protein n=1 Tax=Vibrio cholerae TaxID=666 RepID=UPI002081B4F0|nr:hypothetical protein [Vibrio cholerae]MEB5517865.1 hypothetical protein [Vibrio cholerae]GIB52642.1 hypothetical protein VCSRO187_3373 [Vibrio cholerae]
MNQVNMSKEQRLNAQGDTTLNFQTIYDEFRSGINSAEEQVENLMAAMNTPGAAGQVTGLTSLQAFELQKAMGQQQAVVNTATSSLKAIKDGILAAARNI